MTTTVTEYKSLAIDSESVRMPVGKLQDMITVQTQSSPGAFAALNASTKFIRIATDTAVTISWPTLPNPMLVNVGTEFFDAPAGQIITTATVA